MKLSGGLILARCIYMYGHTMIASVCSCVSSGSTETEKQHCEN